MEKENKYGRLEYHLMLSPMEVFKYKNPVIVIDDRRMPRRMKKKAKRIMVGITGLRREKIKISFRPTPKPAGSFIELMKSL